MKLLLSAILGYLLLAFDRHPHRKLIKQWSTLFHLKTKFHNRYTDYFSVDVVDDILYISRYNKAVHDEKEYIYSIAHEFGHLLDYAYREHSHEDGELYSNFTDKEMIYRDEVVAWKIAKVILEDAGIYEKKSFNALKNRCLKDYRTDLKLSVKKSKKKTKKASRAKRSKASK